MFEYSYQRTNTGGFGSPVVPVVYCKMYVDGEYVAASTVMCFDGSWLAAMHRAREIVTDYWVDSWLIRFLELATGVVGCATEQSVTKRRLGGPSCTLRY